MLAATAMSGMLRIFILSSKTIHSLVVYMFSL